MRIAVLGLTGLMLGASISASLASPMEDLRPAKQMHPRFAGELFSSPHLLNQIEPGAGLPDTAPGSDQIWCRAVDYEFIQVLDRDGSPVDGVGYYAVNCVEE